MFAYVFYSGDDNISRSLGLKKKYPFVFMQSSYAFLHSCIIDTYSKYKVAQTIQAH